MVPVDLVEQQRQQLAEQAAANERARTENIRVFQAMWLTLGADVLKLVGTAHDAELAEAKGLAAHRWNVLLNQEAHVMRDEQALAESPKKRPSDQND
jgi:hypothetical protein